MEQLGTCEAHKGTHRRYLQPCDWAETTACVNWHPVPAPAEPAEYTCPRCESKISTHICMKAEPVAGETRRCTIPPDGWLCSRKKGHEGPCAARPITTAACDERLSEEIGEELGFEVKRWDGDVLIRDSDSTEWTSAVVWARSAPQTIAVMLSDAFASFVQCRARIARNVTPAPAVAAPGEGTCTKCGGSRADRQHIHNPIVSWPTHDFMASTPPIADPQWRVGKQVPLNVYEGDRPVCQCHTEEDARRIVEAVNGRS